MAKYWLSPPPDTCDICASPIDDEFIDGKTKYGPWANMCPKCFHCDDEFCKSITHNMGIRLGIGFGQRFRKEGKKKGREWVCVEGDRVG